MTTASTYDNSKAENLFVYNGGVVAAEITILQKNERDQKYVGDFLDGYGDISVVNNTTVYIITSDAKSSRYKLKATPKYSFK